MKKLGQFEIIEEQNILTCRYVCGLIPNAELFEPFGTGMIKSFKIRRRDFDRQLGGDMARLKGFIHFRLIHIACFDVDLTLYDVQTWYKTDKPPQIRNRKAITETLASLKNLETWRTIVITNNYFYNISKKHPQANHDLDELLGGEFFDKKYTRTDMTELHKKNFLSIHGDYTWQRDGNKIYPLRCYHAELCRNTAIGHDGFLNLKDKTGVIDVVSAFLVDDTLTNLDQARKHGVFPIEARYIETERDGKNHVVCVQTDDDASYVNEINHVIAEGLECNQFIDAPLPLYQQLRAHDDGYEAKSCCCARLFTRKKGSDQIPLVKPPNATMNFGDL